MRMMRTESLKRTVAAPAQPELDRSRFLAVQVPAIRCEWVETVSKPDRGWWPVHVYKDPEVLA